MNQQILVHYNLINYFYAFIKQPITDILSCRVNLLVYMIFNYVRIINVKILILFIL
jgi:hypothetical protein